MGEEHTMARMELSIDIKGDAMMITDHDTGEELGPDFDNLAGILQGIAALIEGHQDHSTIFDVNGNSVGHWSIS